MSAASTWTSGGARAGAATNSSDGLLAVKRGHQRGLNDEVGRELFRAPDEFPGEPEEGLLKVIIGLGRNFKVLQVLLPVECNGTSLYFAILSDDRQRKADVCLLQQRLTKWLRTFTSTLFPHKTMGMFSHTRSRSRCQFGTFLYVILDVTSNMMMPH